MILRFNRLLALNRSLDELISARNIIPSIKLREVYDIREIGKLHELVGTLLLSDDKSEIYELSRRLLDLIEAKLDEKIGEKLKELDVAVKGILDDKEKSESNKGKGDKEDSEEG